MGTGGSDTVTVTVTSQHRLTPYRTGITVVCPLHAVKVAGETTIMPANNNDAARSSGTDFEDNPKGTNATVPGGEKKGPDHDDNVPNESVETAPEEKGKTTTTAASNDAVAEMKPPRGQGGTGGSAVEETGEEAALLVEINSRLGEEYLKQRVAKDFDGTIFYGTVVKYRKVGDANEERYCWLIVFDDGDLEDFTALDLAGSLVLFRDEMGKSSTSKTKDERSCLMEGCDQSQNEGSEGMCRFHWKVSQIADGALDLDATDTEESECEEQKSTRSTSTSSSRSKLRSTSNNASSTDIDEHGHRGPDSNVGEVTSTNETPPNSPQKSDGQRKSPASCHSTPRRRIKTKAPVYDVSSSSSESTSGSDDESDESEEEKLKIERIIACRTETIGRWREICGKINTSEIENGSRWFQDNASLKDDDVEERFLVKWKDLSFLHCSWETERDLMSQLERPKPYFSTFNRKNVNGLAIDEDDRGDGEYFDENMIQIERILEITEAPELPEGERSRNKNPVKSDGPDGASRSKHGIVLDRKDPRYEEGTGRQFLVKWGNTPYSNCSYEFER